MTFKTFIIPLILLLAGAAIVILGALFKIMHWTGGNEILIFGMAIEVVALVFLMLKLIKGYQTKA